MFGTVNLNEVVELTLAFISSNLFISSAFSLRSLIASRCLPPEGIQRVHMCVAEEPTAGAQPLSRSSTLFAKP